MNPINPADLYGEKSYIKYCLNKRECLFITCCVCHSQVRQLLMDSKCRRQSCSAVGVIIPAPVVYAEPDGGDGGSS
jgi:hypothetical protein